MKTRATTSPPASKLDRSGGRAAKPALVRSEGQRRLLAAGSSIDDIAAAVGCGRSTAANWRTGADLPSSTMRERLREVFDIAPGAWAVLPGCDPAEADEPAPAPVGNVSTLDACLALHKAIQRARNAKNLTTAEQVRLADTEARLLALRHRLEEAAAMSESRIIAEHPGWQTVKRAITKVLAGCPRCTKLMSDELTRLDM